MLNALNCRLNLLEFADYIPLKHNYLIISEVEKDVAGRLRGRGLPGRMIMSENEPCRGGLGRSKYIQ